MKFQLTLAALAAVDLGVHARSMAPRAESRFGRRANNAPAPSLGFIVELEAGSNLVGRDAADPHAAFHQRARRLVGDYSVRHEFKNPEYFYGMSIDASNDTAAALLALPEVKKVWPNRYHDRPVPVSLDESGSGQGWKKRKACTNKVAHVTGTSDVNSSLKMTGVDAVHAMGITGKGVKIGILDTGVDWRHPALGGGFGDGFKIAGGSDLVGDAYTGYNVPEPDDDPLVTCLSGGHGTHVAGIIGAQDPDGIGFGITGVAPEADLYMFRILGCAGGVTDDVMMQGFQAAAEAGVDLVSMSVGGASLWESGSPYDSLFASLTDKGIGLIIAAGNDGAGGVYYASSPALVSPAISVGSVSNTKFATLYNVVDSAGSTVEYARVVPFNDTTPYHVLYSFEDDDGSCNQDAWNQAIVDFPDKDHVIVIMDFAGSCTQSLDYWVSQSGFTKIWYFDSTDPGKAADLTLYPPGYIATYEISKVRVDQAEKIVQGISSQGTNYTLLFNDQSVHDDSQPTANTTSYFSSYGPTLEMSLKPQLSAPGGNILSTWPTPGGWGYALISGTSMATPHAAGCYALIKQKYPDLAPQEIASLMQSTSTPLSQYQGDGILTTTVQQGSGLINVYKAINYDTTISPTELNLRDSSTPSPQKVTIVNKSSQSKAYSLGHKGAAQLDALPNLYSGDYYLWDWSLVLNSAYASASFSQDTLSIPAGGQATIEITITPPAGLDPSKLPLYGGYVTITDTTDGKDYVIPYAGVPYSRASVPALDVTNLTNPTTKPLPPAGIPLMPYIRILDINQRDNDIATLTFPAWAPPPDSDEDQEDDNNPALYFSIRQPSPYVRIDVVPVDTPFVPTYYGFDTTIKYNTTTAPLDLSTLESFAGVQSYGVQWSWAGGWDKPASRFQDLWNGYGEYAQPWAWAEVALANGTLYQLPNADYRLLLRVLKWGEVLEDASSYESWLGPIIRVNITDPGYPNPYLAW